MKPTFFAAPEGFRAWLEEHHANETELVVGFYKKGSGKPSMTWSESVDEALCFGWIDGIRKGLDDESYTIRFTPRKPGSTWSAANIGRVKELRKLGRMAPAGLDAFGKRRDDASAIYAYEQRHNARLEPREEETFRANAASWAFFQGQPAGYRKTALWWVTSAKRQETRQRRLQTLIQDSEQGRAIAQLRRSPKS